MYVFVFASRRCLVLGYSYNAEMITCLWNEGSATGEWVGFRNSWTPVLQ